jgi:hypothetical protein
VPLLPVLVGGALVVVAIAFIVLYFTSQGTATKKVGAVQCNPGEQLQTHYHAHLAIIQDGQDRPIPGQIGITDSCLYWLHTHDTSGVIHIEAPADQTNHTFTLGDFFDVWGQPLDSTHVATFTLTSDEKLVAYVDGQLYTGDPASIPLKSHTTIVLEIQPPAVVPPPSYTWDTSSYPK